MRESGSEGRPGTDFAAEEHHMPHVRKQNAPQTDRQDREGGRPGGFVRARGNRGQQPAIRRPVEREREMHFLVEGLGPIRAESVS